MVESPTYYFSLSPILKSLKDYDMENFPLKEEIVQSEADNKLPEYLSTATMDISILFSTEVQSQEIEMVSSPSVVHQSPTYTPSGPILVCPKELKVEENIGDQTKLPSVIASNSSSSETRSDEIHMLCSSSFDVQSPQKYFKVKENIKDETKHPRRMSVDTTNCSSIRSVESPMVCSPSFCNQSPTYASSKAILVSPKEFNVEVKREDHMEDHTEHSTSISSSSKTQSKEIPVANSFLKKVKAFLETNNSPCLLEESQAEALKHALGNKLAIIQGL